jgi:hypothetical protein
MPVARPFAGPLPHGALACHVRGAISITTVATEERREGIACFRMLSFGATPHLAIHGEPPAFAARFRECHANDAERRD